MRLDEHEPTTACGDFHCFWHNVDEPAQGYRLCYECMHMYLTEDELIAAYWDGGEDHAILVLLMTGETITFCPLCSHDFLWGIND